MTRLHPSTQPTTCVCGWNDNITIFSRLFECFICLGWCWTWLCRRSDDAIRLFARSNNSRPRISATSFFFPRYYWTLDWQLCESFRLIALCVFGRRRFSSFNTNFAGHQSLLTGDGQTFVVTAHPWRENPPSPQLRSNSISSLFLVVPVMLGFTPDCTALLARSFLFDSEKLLLFPHFPCVFQTERRLNFLRLMELQQSSFHFRPSRAGVI